MTRKILLMSASLFIGAGVLAPLGVAAETSPVYFLVSGTEKGDAFVIALTDEAKIAQARAIVAGDDKTRIHVHGTVDPSPVRYNPGWKFHLDPDSIDFFELAAEVCDASTSYVDAHLAEVGGAFLPGGHWCPWSSAVTAEIEGH